MPALQPLYLDDTTVAARDLRGVLDHLQPGVMEPGDLKVTVSSGLTASVAAGVALIPDGQARPTSYRCEWSGAAALSNTFEGGGIPTADPTLPRIDQIVAEVLDNTLDGLGERRWRLRVLAGTPTGGATLDNRSGAAILGARMLRLADGLVSPGATTITLRDRRAWAKGASFALADNGGLYSTSSINAWVPLSRLSARIECTGRPLRVECEAACNASTAGAQVALGVSVDGVVIGDAAGTVPPAVRIIDSTQNYHVDRAQTITPTPGSHVVTIVVRGNAGTTNVNASDGLPAQFFVRELASASARNN